MDTADYARLAQRAYTQAPTIGAADSAARAVLLAPGVIGFPGTNNIACWLADLHVDLHAVPGMGNVHGGFHDAFSSIAAPLLALEGVDITLGHSEGAALALLYGAALCLAGKPPKAIYAFEPPRISADETLARLFTVNRVKLVLTRNGNDIVPMVPRALHPWQHPGPLAQIGSPSLGFLSEIHDHLLSAVIPATEYMK